MAIFCAITISSVNLDNLKDLDFVKNADEIILVGSREIHLSFTDKSNSDKKYHKITFSSTKEREDWYSKIKELISNEFIFFSETAFNIKEIEINKTSNDDNYYIRVTTKKNLNSNNFRYASLEQRDTIFNNLIKKINNAS